MGYDTCYSGRDDHRPMWTEPRVLNLGGRQVSVRSSLGMGGELMSLFGEQVSASAKAIVDGYITVRTSTTVPDVADIKLGKNEGVEIDATYLYPDMADSSTLAQTAYKPVTAKIIRSFLNPASDILRHYGGEIRSFDGDRVMAIFIGTSKEMMAVRAALAINWLVEEELGPRIAKWTDLAQVWKLRHSIGIDIGDALLTRTGVRGDNDIVSVGSAPNVAAKLSDLRDGYAIHITDNVYEPMGNEVAFVDGVPFWRQMMPIRVGNKSFRVKACNAHWEP